MNRSIPLIISSVAVSSGILAVIYSFHKVITTQRIKEKLPKDLKGWHHSDGTIWPALAPLFGKRGLDMWELVDGLRFYPPNREGAPVVNGYFLHTASGKLSPYMEQRLKRVDGSQSLCVMRTIEGQDVICRVMTVGKLGHQGLEALRRVATGPNALFVDNYVLPILREIQLFDPTFLVFPFVAHSVGHSFNCTVDIVGGKEIRWVWNSVDDLMDILSQCLEALEFIHSKRVAHRDAFYDNFLIQYQPESFRWGKIPTGRPRVCLIDFETAISFPEDFPYEACVCTSGPTSDVGFEFERPCPEFMSNPEGYNPFDLDMWQLALFFRFINTSVPEIDKFLSEMQGMRASVAHDTLRDIIGSFKPVDLLRSYSYDKESLYKTCKFF